jgi:hypothetical protein
LLHFLFLGTLVVVHFEDLFGNIGAITDGFHRPLLRQGVRNPAAP